jgi:peroxiredoxin
MTQSCRMRTHLLWLALLVLAGGLLARGNEAEAAAWRNLNGRMAPDLVFAAGGDDVAPGTRLSSFRNKEVVLLVFWVRDCPHCRRELPKVQSAFDRWGRSGLQVITVVHGFPLEQVRPTMKRRGWTFPVVSDADGSLAAMYGGGRRPGSYVIGIDGRIKAGPTLAMRVIEVELGRWRLKELGTFPTELAAARDEVYKGDYGGALRSAEPIGAAVGASTDIKAAVARLLEIAARKLQVRAERAEDWLKGGNVERARQEYLGIAGTAFDGILKDFAGTSLAARATALYDSFRARAGG